MNLDDQDYVQREILFQGGYERVTLRLFHRLLKQAGGFLDIGAHHGQYSLRAARELASRGGRVFAFEPTPANCAALLENAACSGLSNIDVCTVALSDEHGIMRLVAAHGNTGGSHLASPKDPCDSGSGIHVAVRPFADVVGLIPPSTFDLVKIDVEGFEARALSSLLAGTATRPRHIIFEYVPDAFDYGLPDGLPSWLQKQGYTIRDVTGAPYILGQTIPEQNLWAELAT